MASVLQKATPPLELDFDLSQTSSSPTASGRQFMRRSQSFSELSYSPTEHQEFLKPQQQPVGSTGFPTPVTPTRSHKGIGPASLHTPSGTTMQSSNITRSDSKYNSQTIASRSGDQRRARQQRRKTDGSDEIHSMRRPSTSHASSPPRKVAYSQYPDFEDISDPFAKRDKIPQKSERPFLLDVVAATSTVPVPAVELKDFPQTAHSGSKQGSVERNELYNSPQTPIRSHSRQHTIIGDSAPRNTTEQSNHVVAAPLETRSSDLSPEPPVDTITTVPTPLRTLDKIPRHTVQPAPSLTPDTQPRVDGPLPAPLRMESTSSSPSKPPVSPTKPRSATGSSATRSMGKSLLISSLVSPASPNHPANSGNRLRAPGNGSVSRAPPPLYAVDSNVSVLSTPVRPFSDHKSSPRLQIDMDKVDTLYERRSIVFEKNRSKIRDRTESTATSPLGSQARSPMSVTGKGLLAMVDEAEDSKDGEHAEETDNQESEHFIPFDQVLIPTAFKRLRAALEDPTFEIDEDTYRRFKLSERWYSREEQMQMERAFTQGTFGESKKRSRIIQKRLSDASADSSALGHGHTAVGDMSESYRGQSELPTPPVSALSLNDQQHHRQRLESLQEEEALDYQEPPVTATAVPERRRTRSSRRPSGRSHHTSENPASSHHQVPLPGGYAPPPSMNPTYAKQPEARMQGAAVDYHLQQQQQQVSDEAVPQDSRHRNSRHHRPTAQPSTSAVEQTERSSGGCCGCTIM